MSLCCFAKCLVYPLGRHNLNKYQYGSVFDGNNYLPNVFFHTTKIYDQKLLCKHILDIVNKTNLLDYTMDIRTRLGMDSVMPEELAVRKAKVMATLNELTEEVKPITAATEKLKDTDHMKDSKTFLNILQKEYNVS